MVTSNSKATTSSAKVLVFLLTLGFAASAFALDLGNGLTLVGEVKTGLKVATSDDGKDDTEDTKAGGWNDDAGQMLRVRLTAGYAADWGGAKIRLQSDGVDFFAKFAYGWANFLDKKIAVYGGLAIEDLWGLGKLSDNVFDPSVDNVNGVRVALNLVDGLSFGVALPFDQVNYYDYDSGSGLWGKHQDKNYDDEFVNRTIGNVFGGVVIGGLYKSDIFSAAAGVRLYPEFDSKVYGGTPDDNGKYGTVEGYADIIAGVEVNPVSGLKVVLDGRIDTRKLASAKDTYIQGGKIGFTRIGLKGLYTVGAITPYLKADIAIQNQGADNKGLVEDRSVTKDSFAHYVPGETLGDTSFAFEVGAKYAVTDTLTAYLGLGSDNAAWLAGDKDKGLPGNGLYVKPGVKITVGGGSIEIFDKVNKLGADEIKGTTPAKDHSPVINQFQIDFNWSF